MRPLFKAFLIVLLVFVGISVFHLPALANDKCHCKVHGDTGCTENSGCAKLKDICKENTTCCCPGTICEDGICKGGLFTKGQSAECLAKGNCDKCDLLVVIKNVFQLLVQIAGALAVLSLVIVGIMHMIGGGILGERTTLASAAGVLAARKALIAVITGFIIVLFAWSMINWMMHFLEYKQPYGEYWWSIQCEGEAVSELYCCTCGDGSTKKEYSSKTECDTSCSSFCTGYGGGGICIEGPCGTTEP